MLDQSLPMFPQSLALSLQAPEGLLSIDWSTAAPLAPALREILADFPNRFTRDALASPAIAFCHQEGAWAGHGFAIEIEPGRVHIKYSHATAALRALNHIMACALLGESIKPYTESSPFRTRGVMIDASRNGVPRVETVKLVLRKMALMGLNRLMLYCEDTYEIPGEPFFGYFRGRYSQEELREVDRYAALFDIDVVPCIQTLGHCEQFLQWPRFAELKDTGHVLIAEDEKSYEFIGQILDAASAPFRSKEIHVGMDEAHGIGSGFYRIRHGLKKPFEILNAHLAKVSELCTKRGLKPMIWSDMFFRLGSKINHYYDPATIIPPEVGAGVPPGLRLVYWDYYHHDVNFYRDWIARHVAMGHKPVFACGVWCWNRFWTSFEFSFAAIRAGMDAAREFELDEVLVTLWSDDGAECDLLSALPGLQFFAEKCFAGDADQAPLHFSASTNGDWEAWLAGSGLDEFYSGGSDGECPNPAKWIFWHDPLLGFLESHMDRNLADYFSAQAERLKSATQAPGDNARLLFPQLVAETLSVKCLIHRDLRDAYRARDLSLLRSIAYEQIPKLKILLGRTHRAHAELWHALYKPFGWEVLDRRYGGLSARLSTLVFRLEEFLVDPTSLIDELEENPKQLCSEQLFNDFVLTHNRTSSPSALV